MQYSGVNAWITILKKLEELWQLHCLLWRETVWLKSWRELAGKQCPSLPTRHHSNITFSKSLSFHMTTFSASLTNLTVLLPQSRDCIYYVSRWILAPSPIWMQKHTDPRANEFANSPDFWHQARIVNITCAWSWRLCGISPAILYRRKRCVKVCLSDRSGDCSNSPSQIKAAL